jgi:hypothetical protein
MEAENIAPANQNQVIPQNLMGRWIRLVAQGRTRLDQSRVGNVSVEGKMDMETFFFLFAAKYDGTPTRMMLTMLLTLWPDTSVGLTQASGVRGFAITPIQLRASFYNEAAASGALRDPCPNSCQILMGNVSPGWNYQGTFDIATVRQSLQVPFGP